MSDAGAQLTAVPPGDGEVVLNEKQSQTAVGDYLRKKANERAQTALYDALYPRLYGAERLAERPFLNIGAGQFYHKYWRVADRTYGDDGERWVAKERGAKAIAAIDHYFDYFARTRLDIADNSLDLIYTSHSLEHTFDPFAQHALNESFRILRKGGIMRVVLPDAELGFRACQEDDRGYFPKDDLRGPMENYLIRHVAVCLDKGYNGAVNQATVKKTVREGIAKGAFEETMGFLYQCSWDHFQRVGDTFGRHCNWYSFDKIAGMVRQAGFSTVQRSAYTQSIATVLRDTRYFDKTRPSMSLYLDAIK